jgi:hypothetical protein
VKAAALHTAFWKIFLTDTAPQKNHLHAKKSLELDREWKDWNLVDDISSLLYFVDQGIRIII